MFQTPHFSSDSWVATSTPTHVSSPGSGAAIREAGCCVWERHLIPGDLKASSLLPYVNNKNLIKQGGRGSLSKKEEKVKKEKKKEGKKEKITLCFLLKSTKCNIYRYHIDLDPGRGGSGPVKHRKGGGGQFKAGEGAQKPPPQPSLNPAYDYQKGGCSQAYPSPIPSQAGVTPS